MPAGGELFINGDVRRPTWTRLAVTAEQGAVEIEVEDAVEWVAGDEIVLATSNGWDKHDVAIIAKRLGPRRLLLQSPLKHQHWSVRGVINELTEVGLLTRNVKIQVSKRP